MIRLLVFLDASSITGPAKNLLEFHAQQRKAREPVQMEFATIQRGGYHDDLTRAAEAAGIPVHRIAERFAFDIRVIAQIRSLLRRIHPDVIQSHYIKSHFLLRLSGEWKRYRWIAFHHGYTLTSRRLHLYKQLDRWSLPCADHVVTVSRAFARDLQQRGVPPQRLTVLHNAVDPEWGDRARNAELRARTRVKLGVKENERVILIVGRLSLEKSHVQLVAAIARLRGMLPGAAVRLLIVGDGPERPAIELAARAAGCAERIIFAGHCADVLPYYAAADLAVLASITEGSPNALLEAMAARIPVVATSVGGIPELVSHEKTALLVPPSDATALANALAQALANPSATEARTQRAHADVLANHAPEHRARRLNEIYAATMAAGSKGPE